LYGYCNCITGSEIYSALAGRVTFFARAKKVTKETRPAAMAPNKFGAALTVSVLLQGRMDAPSGLIHAKTHIPVRFTLAKLHGSATLMGI
jgi:hypothetical protein